MKACTSGTWHEEHCGEEWGQGDSACVAQGKCLCKEALMFT